MQIVKSNSKLMIWVNQEISDLPLYISPRWRLLPELKMFFVLRAEGPQFINTGQRPVKTPQPWI